MLSWSNNLFELHSFGISKLPEDPLFLRKDGSIFFESTIHEGECFLYPQGEDISKVLVFGNWLPLDSNYKPVVPAKDYQVPYPALTDIIEDALYPYLIRIKNESNINSNLLDVRAVTAALGDYCPPCLKKHSSKCYLPKTISRLPKWFHAFELFLLGKCNAYTGTSIDDAILNCGYVGVDSFNMFYILLDQYLDAVKTHTKKTD